MHPSYQRMIDALVAADRVRRWRRRLDVARLSRLRRPFFCFVSHDFGGGTETYINTLSRALGDVGVHVLVAWCSGSGRIRIMVGVDAGIQNLVYDLPAESGALMRDMLPLGIAHFHFQSNINVPADMFALPARCRAAYDCTIHDYSWICPRATLVDASRIYCNQPEERVCDQCVSISGRHPRWLMDIGTVGSVRRQSASVLAGARRVFCPSNDVLLRLRRWTDLPNAVVRPHLEPHALPAWKAPPLAHGEDLRVAVLGAVGPEKGSEVLRRCAYDAFKRGLPLRFIVIGYTDCDDQFRALPNVLLTGAYAPGQLPELLRDHQPHISFFPGVLPETFSYTLSIALHCGLFPIAFDIGAIGERVRSADYGALLPLEDCWVPSRVNDALVENALRAARSPLPKIPEISYPDILVDYYGFPAGQFARGFPEGAAPLPTRRESLIGPGIAAGRP